MRCLVPDCPLCLRHCALAPAEPAALAALKGSLRAPPAAAPLSLAAHAFAFTSSSGPALETPTKASPRSPLYSSLGPTRSPSGLSRPPTGPTRSPRTKAGISRSHSMAPTRTLTPARRTLGLIPLSVSRAHNLGAGPAALAACVRLRDAARGGEKVQGEKAAW
jgi:hypothetical protein